jgi:polysaccharide chain length determinant protein (PEP-CTERM system associated)
MINSEKSFDLKDYVEIFLRRMWHVVIPFVLIITGASLYAYYSPKEYRATALILVTPQKVPEAFVQPTVTSRIEDRLQSIAQEIMSRSRLEMIISEFNPYTEEGKSKGKEEIVELMRKNIKVDLKGKEGYFSISYTGKDPKTVTLVTNKLTSLFVEENLKLREQHAQGASEFLTVELSATKAKLEEQEKAITNFKRQFMGELPEQRDFNARVLEQLQTQYQRIAENLRSAQDRKLLIQKQMADTEMLLISAETARRLEGSEGGDFPLISFKERATGEEQLLKLKGHLEDLRMKYTEKHPDILIVKKRMAELERRLRVLESERELEVAVSDLPAPKIEASRADRSAARLSPHYKEVEKQLVVVEMEIKRLREDEEKIKSSMARYTHRLESTWNREPGLALLTRDYQNTKEAYQTLLKKSLEAQQAENLERRQKGEQFKVIDPARVPEKPFKPNIPKILLYGFLLGTGLGFAVAFFREQMDRSFRDAEDLETTMGYRVLANIPKIERKAA